MKTQFLYLAVACLGLAPLGPLAAQELKLRATVKCTDWVNVVAYSPDGKSLAIAQSMNTLDLWDAATLKSTTVIRNDPVSCLGVSFWSVAFSPDGKTLASANGHSLQGKLSENDVVQLWDAVTGKKIATLEGHTDYVQSVAFSPDGKSVASAGGDQTVRIWDVAARANVATLRGHSNVVHSVAFSPNGKILASANWDKTVKLWYAPFGKKVTTLALEGHTERVYGVAFSPDGKLLASAGDDTVRLWDVATGNNLATLRGHAGWVCCVAFSRDGKLLASGSMDQTIRLWHVGTGKSAAILEGHAGDVQSVAFSPDGKTLASGGRDHTVRFWDLPLAAAAGQDPAPDVKKFAQAKIEAARKAYDFALQSLNNSAPGANPAEVHTWSVRWLKAQQELGGKPSDHVAAHGDHLKRMQDLAKRVHLLLQAGVPGPAGKSGAAVDFYVAEAELWLAKAKAAAKKVTPGQNSR